MAKKRTLRFKRGDEGAPVRRLAKAEGAGIRSSGGGKSRLIRGAGISRILLRKRIAAAGRYRSGKARRIKACSHEHKLVIALHHPGWSRAHAGAVAALRRGRLVERTCRTQAADLVNRKPGMIVGGRKRSRDRVGPAHNVLGIKEPDLVPVRALNLRYCLRVSVSRRITDAHGLRSRGHPHKGQTRASSRIGAAECDADRTYSRALDGIGL